MKTIYLLVYTLCSVIAHPVFAINTPNKQIVATYGKYSVTESDVLKFYAEVSEDDPMLQSRAFEDLPKEWQSDIRKESP